MRKDTSLLIGFLLFAIGLLSIILNIVGVELAFLVWLNSLGSLAAFVTKLLMMLAGIIIMVLARTDWEREEAE